MKQGKSKIEIAAERYGIDPRRFGDTHVYKFAFDSIAAAEQQVKNDRTYGPCLLLSIGGQSKDGLAASYAGLELQFEYGGKYFFSDGKTIEWIPFGILFGRVDPHSGFEWEIPPFFEKQIDLTARVRNTTAGALIPTVVVKTVEIRGG